MNTLSSGYLTSLVPTAEGRYIDFSMSADSTSTNDLYLDLGCNVSELHRRVGTQVYEPAPTITAVQKAIREAGKTGGIVKPQFANTMEVTVSTGIPELEDNVIFDGSRIGRFILSGEGNVSSRRAAVQAIEKEWFAITNISTDGRNELNYGIRADDCRNFVIQNIATRNHDQNSVRLSTRSQNVTVRYCDLMPGTRAQGNGTQRNQHGIVAGSFKGPEPDAPSKRFGMVYSHGHAYYSNKIQHTDGCSINAHAGNIEICGNYCNGALMGPKFPHSANVLSHNNYWGGVNGESGKIAWRIYSANDWDIGVGYACDMIFVIGDHFDNNGNRNIRIDGIHGDVYLIDNRYTNEGGTIVIAPSNKTGTDPNSFRGRVFMHGADQEQRRSDSTRPSVIVGVTDERLINGDINRIIEMMNEPKQSSWAANVNYPLPVVKAWE